MNKAIIGRKVGMTQIFAENGIMIPVTVVEAGPCPVVQVKTVANDGYSGVEAGLHRNQRKGAYQTRAGTVQKGRRQAP